PDECWAANHRDVGWQTELPDAAGDTDARPRAAAQRFADVTRRGQRRWSGSAVTLPAVSFVPACNPADRDFAPARLRAAAPAYTRRSDQFHAAHRHLATNRGLRVQYPSCS